MCWSRAQRERAHYRKTRKNGPFRLALRRQAYLLSRPFVATPAGAFQRIPKGLRNRIGNTGRFRPVCCGIVEVYEMIVMTAPWVCSKPGLLDAIDAMRAY
jgi:hypothetical protein